ncbi:MAG: conserved rane protein of unknown function, partial [Gammaproteobacteria bacterium]|nr:conserved rane protein of unknown function [Gammaproteobacteria bacterium]
MKLPGLINIILAVRNLLVAFVLVWLLAPLMIIHGQAPFASPLHRLYLMIVIIVLWLLKVIIVELFEKYADHKFINKLLTKTLAANASPADFEQLIKERFKRGLQILKEIAAKKGLSGRRLHKLPWYIIAGTPGSGKTSLLTYANFGLPLAKHFDANVLNEAPGQLKWWFTDDAILINVHNDYEAIGNDPMAEQLNNAWLTFLNLLKKTRRPLP